MDDHNLSQEGYKRINYPENRKSRKPIVKYSWVGTPYGRVAKTIISLAGLRYCKVGTDITREFAKSGANEINLYRDLLRFIPWFPEEYFSYTGRRLTSHIVRQRFMAMREQAQKNKRGIKPCVSSEDHRHDKRLRSISPRVEAMMLKGHEFTRQDCENICR